MLENNFKRFDKIISIVVLSLCLTLIAIPGVCATPKKVAVIPFSMNSPEDLGFLQKGLFAMLSSRLSDPGKVDVLDRETIDKGVAAAQQAAETKGALTESKARILGAKMGVDYVLFGSLTQFGDSVSLDASMVDVAGEKQTLAFFKQSNSMGDVIPMVNTFAGDVNLKVFNRSIANELYARPEPQEPQAPGGLQYMGGQAGGYAGGFVNLQQTGQKGFLTHLKFDGQINALAAGDVTKDGVVRILAATDYEIIIHKFMDNKLLVEKKLEFNSTHRIIALDIADINNNGFPEIFVTSLNIQREGLQSFVLEYNGTTYTTLTEDESYYFRVIDGQDGIKILLGQKSSAHPFEGGIYTMTASDNRYTAGQKLRMPRSVSVLSLAKGPVTAKDASEYVLINEHGRLTVVSDTGNIDWEGTKKFGATSHYFLLPKADSDASYQERVYFNSRLLFYDVGEDGKPKVFAVHNEELGDGVLGRYKRFIKGSIEILSWNGIALAPMFKTQTVPGWISDYVIADFDGDNIDELIVSVVGKNKNALLLSGKQTSIISYKLK
ncbi:MAG: CsgG/HfaB family protein [Proteobacteria bacterium]|nr:CsgG/HfaB family protein [Pseudomonadota bacterium]MBU1582722.1 CsgG/HfaB family protein [Pseudomonadota bacterium]MBU2628740.1 CsgG/HfaB family protein [Pseudomonadota bacterium]